MLRKLVLVENATIDALAARPEVVAALPQVFAPFLRDRTEAARPGCGKCRAKAMAASTRAYSAAKGAIVALDPAAATTLRGFLDTERIRVMLPGSGGRATPRDL